MLCVLEDKIARCLCRCSDKSASDMDMSSSALAAELGNRCTWDPLLWPGWLKVEVLQRLEIREVQATVVQYMLQHLGGPGMAEEAQGAILQLIMGAGKTRVVLPMLVLALCGLGELPRLHFLTELLLRRLLWTFLFEISDSRFDAWQRCIVGSLLQVKQLVLPFNRDVVADSESLSTLHTQLSFSAKSRAFLCISREQRQSLELKAQVWHQLD